MRNPVEDRDLCIFLIGESGEVRWEKRSEEGPYDCLLKDGHCVGSSDSVLGFAYNGRTAAKCPLFIDRESGDNEGVYVVYKRFGELLKL